MNDPAEPLRIIDRLNLGLGLAAVLGAALIRPQARIVGGVALGSAIACANFHVIRKVAERFVAARSQALLLLVLLAKMVALFAVVGAAMKYLRISVIGLVVGLSVFVVSVLAATIMLASAKPDAESSFHG